MLAFGRFTKSRHSPGFRKTCSEISSGGPLTSAPTSLLFADPKRLLLDMAREHVLPDLLRLVVDRLTESPRVALARIWLMRRSEDCGGCVLPAECRDRSACLH